MISDCIPHVYDSFAEVLLYRELPLVSRGPARKEAPASISDRATNVSIVVSIDNFLSLFCLPFDHSTRTQQELLQTLQTAGDLADDWEIVYPDCPVGGKLQNGGGPFSIPG